MGEANSFPIEVNIRFSDVKFGNNHIAATDTSFRKTLITWYEILIHSDTPAHSQAEKCNRICVSSPALSSFFGLKFSQKNGGVGKRDGFS